jgi:hypothetical protein
VFTIGTTSILLIILYIISSSYSLQLRRNDFPYKPPATSIVNDIKRLGILPECSKLYLSTDSSNINDYLTLSDYFNIITLKTHYFYLLPVNITNDYIMLIEQYICSRSILFIGTQRSSVTEGILKYREVLPLEDEITNQLYSWDLKSYYLPSPRNYMWQHLYVVNSLTYIN